MPCYGVLPAFRAVVVGRDSGSLPTTNGHPRRTCGSAEYLYLTRCACLIVCFDSIRRTALGGKNVAYSCQDVSARREAVYRLYNKVLFCRRMPGCGYPGMVNAVRCAIWWALQFPLP